MAELEQGSQYSPLTGLVYIFNLIVGTGALTLPAAFHDAGWALSAVIITMLAFMSYLTATFMIESMAAANAIIHWKRLKRLKRSNGAVSDELITRTLNISESSNQDSPVHSNLATTSQSAPTSPANMSRAVSTTNFQAQNQFYGRESPSNFAYVNRVESDDENEPLIAATPGPSSNVNEEISERIPRNVSTYYEITEVIEMGKMASMFFNKTGRTLFYICITIYLYGDLAIYGAAVAKSLRDVACTYKPENSTSSFNISDAALCWEGNDLTRITVYRISLAIFVGIVGPFAFCNVQKTKYLQIFTTLMRWLAFGFMVTLACLRLSKGIIAHPPLASIAGLPNLFGVCVYSFMCHHSLPSLVTPISGKKHIIGLLAADYVIILAFYFLLAFTGIFAFQEINDLYTLNFQHKPGEPWYFAAIHYFLSLFPVFTLSTNFPIIAITLRNNLKSLFLTEGRMYSWTTRSCIFPLLALVPPVGVAFATNSLEFLVGITGSYAGAGIQYIVPAFLVYTSRQVTQQAIGVGVTNHHSSRYKSTFWVFFVNLWAIGCVVLVTWNHISVAVKN